MSQAPATPKHRRWLLRAAARIAPQRARSVTERASERAALDLRRARKAQAPGPEGEVVFLIPLVGSHHVGDWNAVENRFARTIDSLCRQTDGAWRAVVCGQDRPSLPEDDRLHFLPFGQRREANDKWDKLSALCRGLAEHGPLRGYAMPFDADDLLHPEAVAEMRRRQARGGYLVREGYVRDVSTGRVALAGPPTPARPLRKPFWKLCGSCAAFAYDLRSGEEDIAFLEAATRHEHRMFPHLAALAGRPLAAMEKPAVLYELNHGENFGARRGRGGFKTRFVDRFAVDDPAVLRGIGAAFPAEVPA